MRRSSVFVATEVLSKDTVEEFLRRSLLLRPALRRLEISNLHLHRAELEGLTAGLQRSSEYLSQLREFEYANNEILDNESADNYGKLFQKVFEALF